MPKLPTFLQTLLLILISASEFVTADYPAEFVAQVQGYPNIISNKEQCLPLKGSYDHASTFVCDPTRLLTVDQINHLNKLIYDIKDTVNHDAALCDSNSPRPVIGVALVNKMKVGNQVPDKLLSYASVFAYYLFDTWNLPANCPSDLDKLIIFYSKEDGALYTFAGDLLKQRLPSKFIINTGVNSRVPFSEGIFRGIAFLIQSYREAVTSGRRSLFNTP